MPETLPELTVQFSESALGYIAINEQMNLSIEGKTKKEVMTKLYSLARQYKVRKLYLLDENGKVIEEKKFRYFFNNK